MTHVNESYCTALGKRTSMWIHELCVCVYMQKNTLHRYTHIYVVKTTHLYKKENTPFYVCVYLRNFFCLHVCTHIKFISTHQNSFRVLCDMTRSHESCLTHMSHAWLIWVMPHSYESCLTHMSHAWLIWVMPDSYESCLTHMSQASLIWVMPDSYESCLAHMSHAWLIWVMPHSYESRRLFPIAIWVFLWIVMILQHIRCAATRCNKLQHTLQQRTIVIPLWKDSSYE